MYKDSFGKNFSEQLSEALQSVKKFLRLSLFSNKAVNIAKPLYIKAFRDFWKLLKSLSLTEKVSLIFYLNFVHYLLTF